MQPSRPQNPQNPRKLTGTVPRKPGEGRKVVVAMSGGVDSSAAAKLLKDDGYEVVGVFMRNGAVAEPEDACDLSNSTSGGRAHKQGCCSVNDTHDARLVAATLGIPFYVVNFQRDFGRIMDYFVAEYNAGRTPNPCVRCNDWLKFGKLHAYARSIDADYVATGHYARVIHASGGSGGGAPRLLRGVDRGKDQSYVLFGSPREQLAHMLLPIGGYEKPVIRRIAQDAGLPTFNKPDSQEICFVPDNDYAHFIEKRTEGGFAPGSILDREGNVVGTHPGHQHFTHGQRRRVGVALGYPIYVTEKDPVANTITIGSKHDLLATGCTASQTNWLVEPGEGWRDCRVKIRYNSDPAPGRFRRVGGEELEVAFDEPIEAVTPGQAVVCYGPLGSDIEDDVLCGGWIDTAHRG